MAAGKSDVVVKLILVFFISLLSFSIGTFVGKNYSDNQHRRAALEPDAHAPSRSTASSHDEGSHGEGTMSDDEISKLAAEFADEETSASPGHGEAQANTHATAPSTTEHGHEAGASGTTPKSEPHHAPVANHGTATAVTTPAAAPTAASQAAKNLVAGQPATPATVKAPEHRKPSSIPQDVAQYSVGKFTVQIASFPAEKEAKTRAEELKTKGYSAFYVPANIKGQTWYRVSVGLFSTEEEAKSYRQDFMTKTQLSTAIVQKITN